MWVFIVLAVVTLATLSAIAAYYLIKVKQLNNQQNQLAQSNQQAWLDHQIELSKDLKFIANAMIQGQCEITEGCLRLKVLMDRLDETLQEQEHFKAIIAHFHATSSMPTHKAYASLTRKEQFALDNKRYQLEHKSKEAILQEAKTLLKYDFQHKSIIH